MFAQALAGGENLDSSPVFHFLDKGPWTKTPWHGCVTASDLMDATPPNQLDQVTLTFTPKLASGTILIPQISYQSTSVLF